MCDSFLYVVEKAQLDFKSTHLMIGLFDVIKLNKKSVDCY